MPDEATLQLSNKVRFSLSERQDLGTTYYDIARERRVVSASAQHSCVFRVVVKSSANSAYQLSTRQGHLSGNGYFSIKSKHAADVT